MLCSASLHPSAVCCVLFQKTCLPVNCLTATLVPTTVVMSFAYISIVFQSSCPSSVAPGPGTAAPLRKLLEMHISRRHLTPTESETLRVKPRPLFSQAPPGATSAY